MVWRRLLEPEIKAFIRAHERDDVAKLALKKPPYVHWPYPEILDQIKSRQKAEIKLPQFLEVENFIFPSSVLMEQASSYVCATYKAKLLKGKKLLDLTAGSGADAFFMAQSFEEVDLVDRDPHASELLIHNSQILQKQGFLKAYIQAHQCDAHSFLDQAGHYDLIFIDPQRRDTHQRGIFELTKASPDIMTLLPIMQQKTKRLLIKASPVLDIHKVIKTIPYVSEVHVIEWRKECREVLYNVDFESKNKITSPRVIAVDLDDHVRPMRQISFRYDEEENAPVLYNAPSKYLYEPSACFMKAGAFRLMAHRFNLAKLHPQSHLYTSDSIHPEFPGRVYEVLYVSLAKKGRVGVKSGEIVLRNFPGRPEDLRNKLKIDEGSEHRIFATTLMDGEKRLVVCQKIT